MAIMGSTFASEGRGEVADWYFKERRPRVQMAGDLALSPIAPSHVRF
jgi:hypothetical protein